MPRFSYAIAAFLGCAVLAGAVLVTGEDHPSRSASAFAAGPSMDAAASLQSARMARRFDEDVKQFSQALGSVRTLPSEAEMGRMASGSLAAAQARAEVLKGRAGELMAALSRVEVETRASREMLASPDRTEVEQGLQEIGGSISRHVPDPWQLLADAAIIPPARFPTVPQASPQAAPTIPVPMAPTAGGIVPAPLAPPVSGAILGAPPVSPPPAGTPVEGNVRVRPSP